MGYDEARGAAAKAPCVVWDLPDLETRIVTRDHAGLSHPSGWTVFRGAEFDKGSGSSLDVVSGKLTVGRHSLTVTDVDQAVLAWLSEHDRELSGAQVTRREGFVGVAEAEYPVTRWLVSDYGVADKTGGAYKLELDNVLGPMTRGLYEDFDGETYQLDPDTYPADSNLGAAATTIVLEESPKGVWREPGLVLLRDPDARVCELVEYQTIGGTEDRELQSCARRKWAVGVAGKAFPGQETEIAQVWARRGNPLDIMVSLLTDSLESDGLGLSADLVDTAGIQSVRDQFWPTPSGWTNELPDDGTAILLVEKEPIDDVKRFVEEHLLRPFGLLPRTDAQERFSIETMFRGVADVTEVGGEWRVRDFSPSGWKRNFAARVNALSQLADWDPLEGEHGFRRSKTQDSSIEHYGRSKPFEMAGRGCRTGKFGFPDFGGAAQLDQAGSRVFLELANPATPIKVRVFLRHAGLELGRAITLELPQIPDIGRGTRGDSLGLYLVQRRLVDFAKGYAELEIRRRRPIARPAIVGPADQAEDYLSASEADRQYCYLAPGDGDQMSNGDPAYTVIP